MKFLLDENADIRVAIHLNALGHNVATVAGDHRAGLPDPEVLALAERDGRILVTDDRDYGELVFQDGMPHAGVIFFRLGTTKIQVRIARLDHVLAEHADQLNLFLIVTRDRVRIGGFPTD
jgi:predicted nuclease of predicted toxin-antitoxin system